MQHCPRSLVDAAVGTPERLVFEGAPELVHRSPRTAASRKCSRAAFWIRRSVST